MLLCIMGKPERHRQQEYQVSSVFVTSQLVRHVFPSPNLCIIFLSHKSKKTPQTRMRCFFFPPRIWRFRHAFPMRNSKMGIKTMSSQELYVFARIINDLLVLKREKSLGIFGLSKGEHRCLIDSTWKRVPFAHRPWKYSARKEACFATQHRRNCLSKFFTYFFSSSL